MDTSITPDAPPQGRSFCWPASYKGWGIAVELLPDGSFVGMAEGGYHSPAYPDAQQALADITTWLDTHV